MAPYTDRLMKAEEDGRLGAELLKLNSDPQWRQILPQIGTQ